MAGRDIIVIGASAGGVEALREIVAHLPADLPAAVLIVVHIPPQAASVLSAILARAGPLPSVSATDGLALQRGRVYVAPPDHHLLVRAGAPGPAWSPPYPAVAPGFVRVTRGPRENGHRPAIDPLFRTAAHAFGPRVIGVVLSGNLDDGTAGLHAIAQAGGVGVVQDPADSLYPDMPASAVRHACPSHVVPLNAVAPLLDRLSREPVPHHAPAPRPPDVEDALSEMAPSAMHAHRRPGEPSGFACPECGGALFEFREGEWTRFKCRVGHAYGSESLFSAQGDGIEDALWTALRALEENAALFDRLAQRSESHGNTAVAARYHERVQQVTARAETVRRLLLLDRTTPQPGVPGASPSDPAGPPPARDAGPGRAPRGPAAPC